MALFPRSVATQPVDFAAWLDRGILLAVILACAVPLSMNLAEPDLWGHVRYGQDALRYGLARTTTYSYVAEGYPWINHETLAEYALAIGAACLGGSGLLLAKCLIGTAIVGLMLWRALRQGAGLIAACGLAVIVAMALGDHWSLRPQLASYVGFTLLLALLSYCFEGWEGRWRLPLEYSLPRLKLLWLAPLLFMVWANAHGGFLAGLCIYLAYLAFRGVEAVAHKGRAADGLLLRFGLMGAAAAVATFLNPYGPRFHLWLYADLAVPRPEITEWRPPALFDAQMFPFWLLLSICIASLAASRRPRDFTQLAIFALLIWQSLAHHRHSAFFAIACGWWLPLHFDSLLARLGVGRRFRTDEEIRYGWAPPENAAFSAAFSPPVQQALAILLVVMISLSAGQLASRLSMLKVDRARYPVSAADYIARRGITGKMVCTFNWAQYILGGFGARQPGDAGIQVQIDGRCRTAYSQAMLDAHFDFILGNVGADLRYRDPKSGPFDPRRVLRDGNPDLVLISRRQEPSVEVMERQRGEWTLLYQDQLAQFWGRKSRYDDPHSPFYLPRAQREIGEAVQRGYVAWPALPPYRPAAVKQPASADIAGRGLAKAPRGL